MRIRVVKQKRGYTELDAAAPEFKPPPQASKKFSANGWMGTDRLTWLVQGASDGA